MPEAAIRTRLVQMQVRPGRPLENAARMLEGIERARTDGVGLVVFPEMAIPGYLIGDEWEHPAFLRDCEACAEKIRESAQGLIVIFGSVGIDWERRNEDGRVRKYNALFVAENRKFVGPAAGPYPYVVKTLLPNYREFDDSRHFFDLRKLAVETGKTPDRLVSPVRTGKLALGCMLCEDAWDSDYGLSPLDLLGQAGADCFINISSSPFTVGKDRKRNRVFAAKAQQFGRPLIYVNNVGIQNNGKTVFTFDGCSCVYDGRGGRAACGAPFREEELTIELPVTPGSGCSGTSRQREDDMDRIAGAVLYGTGEFMKLCGVERVTVGISGGIDSSVAAALYARLLPPENLLLVNMPSRHNSPTTRSLAVELARSAGCLYAEIPIEESVELTHSQIDGIELRSLDGTLSRHLRLSSLMMENVQARDRSSRILAAVSAAFGGVFACNANKSEATVGYTTLYGDLCGYFANLADLWKGEVYELARLLNADPASRPIIPEGTLRLTPSAELGPEQNVDRGKGDPLVYPYHDRLFQSWVEWWNRATPEENLEWYAEGTLAERLGYEGRISDLFDGPASFIADLERWWEQYKGMGLAKRIQAPPILAVKRRAFGFDHRESQMGARYTRRYIELKKRLLKGA